MDERAMIRRLMIAVNRIDGLYERAAARLGAKASLICLFYALDDGKPHSQKEISENWLIPRTTLNTIAVELEKSGDIALEPIAGRRREMNILLTESGKRRARAYLDAIYPAEEQAFAAAGLESGDVDALENFCEALKGALHIE